MGAKHPNWRPVFHWKLNGSHVFQALEDLCSRGLCIKWCQANLLIEHQPLFPGTRGRGYKVGHEVIQARLALRQELYRVRADSTGKASTADYERLLQSLCPHNAQLYAYAAGF